MTWIYVQKIGALSRDGNPVGTGYSGNTAGLNNPDMQDKIGIGPIPRGRYTIGPPHQPVGHLGPDALPLYPEDSAQMFGRCGFFIHGDNTDMNHTASDGCIILGPSIRKAIADSGDIVLVVVES